MIVQILINEGGNWRDAPWEYQYYSDKEAVLLAALARHDLHAVRLEDGRV